MSKSSKPKNRTEVIKILESNGYRLVSTGKHEKWSNGTSIVLMPKKHREFHVIGHYQMLKRVGLA
jgi:hypothetical protein